MDTAPNPSTIDVVKVKPRAELQISNQWRTAEGRVDEWFQNYGMLIEALGDDEYELRCSDGAHPEGPDFDDQIVRIREGRLYRPYSISRDGRHCRATRMTTLLREFRE